MSLRVRFVLAILCAPLLLRAQEKNIFDFGNDKAGKSPPAAGGAGRLALPDVPSQAIAEQALRGRFARELADAAPAARVGLARKLIEVGKDKAEKPAERAAALRMARGLAAKAGDFALVSQVVTVVGHAFEVDVFAARLEALQAFLDAGPAPAGARAAAEAGLKQSDAAILREQYDVALKAAVLADGLAARGGADEAAAAFARATAGQLANVRLLQAEAARTAPAVAVLAKSPDDPEANLAVGRFLCFWRGDWSAGLPLLAKGADAGLKALAQEDIAGASDAPFQLALAGAWWDLAAKLEGPPKLYAQDRAADGYLHVVANLEGPDKVVAQKRIAEAPARLPFPRPGADVASAGGAATAIHVVADDFVADIYHNGKLVPAGRRKLLAEIFGAQVERVTVDVKPGDWVVFNVVNNRLRWGGAYYFAAAGLTDKGAAAFASDTRTGDWSACDDLKEVARFVGERDHLRDRRPQPVARKWDRGDDEIKKAVTEAPRWAGEAIWGDPASRSTWVKYVAPER